MITIDTAWRIISETARPLGPELIALEAAHRRTLASPVIAGIKAPRQNVSAMDGYALLDADLARTTRFTVVGASYPGQGFAGSLRPGNCVRIFTGAPVPQGADRVVVQEIVTREAGAMEVTGQWSAARHIRAAGSDFAENDVLVPQGRRLGYRELVAAAAADVAHVTVWRQPRVAIVATGDELVAPGVAARTAAQLPDSLSLALAAFVAEHGGLPGGRHRCGDDPAHMLAAMDEAVRTAELIIITGGASVGEKDFSKSTFARLGGEMLFSKIAMKPGKPVWFGRIGSCLVLGLPGNPTSALVTARLLLASLLAGLCGQQPEDASGWKQAPTAVPLPPCNDRETFVRGYLMEGRVMPIGNQDSGAQKSLIDANILLRRPVGSEARAVGDMISFLDF